MEFPGRLVAFEGLHPAAIGHAEGRSKAEHAPDNTAYLLPLCCRCRLWLSFRNLTPSGPPDPLALELRRFDP